MDRNLFPFEYAFSKVPFCSKRVTKIVNLSTWPDTNIQMVYITQGYSLSSQGLVIEQNYLLFFSNTQNRLLRTYYKAMAPKRFSRIIYD